MKYLDKYRSLNVTESGVFDYFMATLRKSIVTWNYFTDFEKARRNLERHEVSLAILNTLIGKDDLTKEFLKIVKEYPKVRSVLPILIALRLENATDFEIISNLETLETENVAVLFDPSILLTPDIENKLVIFFENSGLRSFIASKRLKSIVDYCYGIEVGLDTNGRKNRTGVIMENLVEKLLIDQFGKNEKYSITKQASASVIESKSGISINFGRNEKGKERRIDFVIFNKKSLEIYAIETNAYMGGGSKLKSTAGEYTGLHELISKQEKVKFIWITDGPGWRLTRAPLKEAFDKIDFVFNLKMVEDGFVRSVIK